MKYFTEEQMHEHARKQRELHDKWFKDMCLGTTKMEEGPGPEEPELPEVEEQEPYGWVHKVTKQFNTNDELRKNYITSIGYDAVFLNR